MVYNLEQYLSEFLLYHESLVDRIFIIDHKSNHDLRNLNLPNITVVRSNHEAQFQSECINLVVKHFGIQHKYDWLFPLDIDEFLPFSDRNDLQSFLKKHSEDKVLQFQWRNGVPFNVLESDRPSSLIDCDSIRFFHKNSMHVKSVANLGKVGHNFVVGTGNHHIMIARLPWIFNLPFIPKRTIYRFVISDRPLFHIVAFDKTTFVEKIKNYIRQIELRAHVIGQGGRVVQNYPTKMSNDDWLWYIANFRVSDESRYENVSIDNFLPEPIFDHLNVNDVCALRHRISMIPVVEQQPQSDEEKAYLKFKTDDSAILENIRWFRLTNMNEIITVIPK